LKLQRVLLSRIDVESEGWDEFIFELHPPNVDRLATSMERVGLLHPLLVLKWVDRMFIVAGYARYLAMKKLGIREAWVRVFQENEISKEELLWISIEENCGGQLRTGAQKRIFRKFKEIGYSVEKIAEEVAPAIAGKLSADEIRDMLKEKEGD